MDYHMQFVEYLSLLQKRGFDGIYEISLSPSKTWTIICNYENFFPFSENVDYHMQFMEFLTLFKKRDISYAIYEFFYFLKKRGQSYAIFGIYFLYPKSWTTICNLWNFFFA